MGSLDGGQIDDYRLDGLIGLGAIADIYRAFDARDGRVVTLKVPRPSTMANPELVRRFRREAAVTAQLDHPLVQRNLDDRHHRSRPYLVLEYLEGENLRTVLTEAGGRVGEARARAWMLDVLTALDHVHSHGYVHCDLKPENLVVGPDGRVRLIDFGDASDLRRPHTRWSLTNGLQGTPEYLAPEQILGMGVRPESDLYALGVIAYEALTGTLPFVGDDVESTLNAALWEPLPHALADRADVSDDVVALSHDLLRRNPADRPRSAAAALVRLDRPADDATEPARSSRVPPDDPPAHGSAASAARRQVVKLISTVLLAFVGLAVVAIATTIVTR